MVSFGNLPNRVSRAHGYSVLGCKGTSMSETYATLVALIFGVALESSVGFVV